MNACIHDRGIVQHDLGDLHGGGDGAADIAVAVVVGDEADLFGGINAGLGEIAAAAGGQTFTDIDIVDLVGVDHAGDSFNQAGEVDVVGIGQNRVDGAGGVDVTELPGGAHVHDVFFANARPQAAEREGVGQHRTRLNNRAGAAAVGDADRLRQDIGDAGGFDNREFTAREIHKRVDLRSPDPEDVDDRITAYGEREVEE